jgi:4-hydroxybenzoate polyprenyltransferase
MDAARVSHVPVAVPSLWRLLVELSRFGRLSVVSFSLLLPMLGAAVVSPSLSMGQFGALAAVAVAFHLFGYVSNDVFDLPLDRTQPLRAGSPLVRGLISPRTALAIALVPVPLAAVVQMWAGGPEIASAVLMAGMGFGLVYNRFGKRIAFPPLSDAIQSLAWVALTLYGALSTGAPLNERLLWLSATVFVYVMLVNALHGGLRDLANDARHGARTTALYFGARVDEGQLIVPRSLLTYGTALQAAAMVFACLGRSPVAVAAIVAAHVVLFFTGRAVLRLGNVRASTLHLFLSIGVVLLPFATTVVIFAVYAMPLLILFSYHGWRLRALTIVLFTLPLSAQQVHVVPRQELVTAMRIERDKGYEICATANAARFNAAVIIAAARAAETRGQMPIVLDHRDYYAAFRQVADAKCTTVPAFIEKAFQHREDQFVDARREKVLRRVVRTVEQPVFVANVVTGWTGAPARYSYEDLRSDPQLRVTHERITSFRLLSFGAGDEILLFDDIHGVSGRALSGVLGLLFKALGDGIADRAWIHIAGLEQATVSKGHKAFIYPPAVTATVDRNGRATDDVPEHLKRHVVRLKQPFDAEYVPLRSAEVFGWTRVQP